MKTIEDCIHELDELKGYIHYKIPLLSACYLGFHKSPYFNLILTTTLWESQILKFKEWKNSKPTKSFHGIKI